MNRSLINEIKTKLSENGFWMYTSCHCDGVYIEKFKNDGIWRVNLCPNRGTFFIIKAGVSLVGKKIALFNEVFTTYLVDIQAQT